MNEPGNLQSQSSALRQARDLFREYCFRYHTELRNPFSGKTEGMDPGDLDAAIELFHSILEYGPSDRQFQTLATQFYSGFHSYLTTPRTEIGALCNAVDRLASLIEPFTKKTAFHFFQQVTIQKATPRGTTITIPLWRTSNYADIPDRVGILPVSSLNKDRDSHWEKQQPHLAIVRKGFTARQKGTHESRVHSLANLEETAYCVIGQYVVIALSLLHNASITEQVRTLTEKARVRYLLRERARAYPLAGALLSRREHLLLYRHRESVQPDRSERRFLFLNYLAQRGPCFYWISDDSAELLDWARQFYGAALDDAVMKNAARYLLEHGQRLSVQKLLEIFGEYNDKAELARYLKDALGHATRKTLLDLAADRREEVALEARSAIATAHFPLDQEVRILARSTCETKRQTFLLMVPRLARSGQLAKYRVFLRDRDLGARVAYAYCLGEVGDETDIPLLRDTLTRKRLARQLRAACWYALTRLYCRYRRSVDVAALLRSRERVGVFSVLDAVDREGLGADLNRVAAHVGRGVERSRRASEAILRIATKNDRGALRQVLVWAMTREVYCWRCARSGTLMTARSFFGA